ncbi:hypothetical protein ACRAR1_02055 [Streptomyces sanyensis]|uniref:hypothetical protein n=1 Tax=Streptomyces sanyensis TaxID=568869 RepID=UPI003D78A2B9
MVGAHLEQLPDVAFLLVFFQAPAALAMFLLGLVAGRLRLLDDPGRHERALRRLLLVGGTLGVAGGLVYAHAGATRPGSAYHVLALGIDVLTAPLLAGAWGRPCCSPCAAGGSGAWPAPSHRRGARP